MLSERPDPMSDYFDPDHSMPENEILLKPCEFDDTGDIAALRNTKSYYGKMALAEALCRKLRYREAIGAYSDAIALRPDDPEAYRQRAARYIATLQPEKAIPDLLCYLPVSPGKADTLYRLGIAYYLAGEYEKAMEAEHTAYFRFDNEMGIAAMYWHTLAAYRCGGETSLLPLYRTDMEVGHHTAYNLAMSLWAGCITFDEAMGRIAAEESALEYSMMAYGAALYAEKNGDSAKCRELIDSVTARDGFWIAYGYLAAYNDKYRAEIKNPGGNDTG